MFQNQVKECNEMMADLFYEYYDELLQYSDEFEQFQIDFKQIDFSKAKKEPAEEDKADILAQILEEPKPKRKLPRILMRNLSSQFGSKAPEKLQRLLFMLRDSADVFEQFCQVSPHLKCHTSEGDTTDMSEPIVHFIFNELASPNEYKKLTTFIYKVAKMKSPVFLDDPTD